MQNSGAKEKVGAQLLIEGKPSNELKPTSTSHSITITINNGVIIARQVNNEVPLNGRQQLNLLQLFSHLGSTQVLNIKPEKIKRFLNGSLRKEDLVLNPVQFVFLSSHGLLGDSEWTSNVPSEGMWVLSEWISKNSSEATALCIDPNMFESSEKLLARISQLIIPGSQVVFGFSMLPVNLQNDIKLFELININFPKARKVVGGIGSDSLEHLPTSSGKKGIQHVLPVDLVIPGYAVKELEILAHFLYENKLASTQDIRNFAEQEFPDLYTNENWSNILTQIIESRKKAKIQFIPQDHFDLVHPHKYRDANAISVSGETTGSVQILSDNRCTQRCSYCAVPKNQVFGSKEEELHYLLEVGKNANVISFNNNDLANDPEKMIWLCDQMVANGLTQQKHGKMRITSYNKDLIDALSRANFVRIACGVESFDKKVRSGLSKADFSDDNIEKSLEHMLCVGITPEINLMLFNQFETEETLRLTTEKSLYWLSQGANVYATFGTYATPNSPSVLKLMQNSKLDVLKRKIFFTQINFADSTDALLFPTQWKTSKEADDIRLIIDKKRKEIISSLQEKYNKKIDVPVEAYIGIVLLAQYFNFDGYENDDEINKKIEQYLQQMLKLEYISI